MEYDKKCKFTLIFTENCKTQDTTEFDSRSDISSITELSTDFNSFSVNFTIFCQLLQMILQL